MQSAPALTSAPNGSTDEYMNATTRFLLVGLAASFQAFVPLRASENSVLASHAGQLVALQGEQLVPFKPESFLKAPYTVLYFGASWCPDCRRFSPSLVSAYDRQKPGARRFEVLLLSRDKSAEDMLKFMKTEKMNWPALGFEKLANAGDLQRFYSGHGIPCLTVIDQAGNIVLQSKDDQDANEVLHQLENLVKTSAKK